MSKKYRTAPIKILRPARPPYSPPPNPPSLARGWSGRWGSYDASCRFCKAPLVFGSRKQKPLVLAGLVCSPLRGVRCIAAALLCRRYGPGR